MEKYFVSKTLSEELNKLKILFSFKTRRLDMLRIVLSLARHFFCCLGSIYVHKEGEGKFYSLIIKKFFKNGLFLLYSTWFKYRG